MKTLEIQPTEDTPMVLLNGDDNNFLISGRSLPEDATEFYQPIIDWLDQYNKEMVNDLEFVFKYEYFNTASSKLVLDILTKLFEMYTEGKKISIKWFYYDDDADMEEAGEEFADLIKMPFELITYDD